jgi:membrane-associated phospholipid phosphatase
MSVDARSRAATTGLVVAAWAVILGVVVGFGWLVTHPLKSSVNPWDDDVSRWFAAERMRALNTPADIGTFLGETIVGMSVAVVVAIGFSLWQRSFLPGVFFAVLTAGVGGFYAIATEVDPRPRPPVKILDPGLVPDASFPSGHVGTATAVFGGIVVLSWVYAQAARWWVAPLLVLPVFVLVARLYEGAHHLTDVLASLGYTVVWLAVLATLLLRDVGAGRSARRS